jgi:hypothetical protein
MLTNVGKKSTARQNDEAIRILQANGIVIWGAFLVDPDWRAEDFDQLRDYIVRSDITHSQFTVLTPLPGTQLYKDRCNELLTDDYTCYDALHSVLPTRLPREEFYRQFAALYRLPTLGASYDLIRDGRISMDGFKRAHRGFQSLGLWENYARNDPILREISPVFV